MKHTLFVLFCLLMTASCSTAGPATAPPTEHDIGRLLMVGFRGTSLEECPDLGDHLENGRIGGVILFDYDVPSHSTRRNIESPQQLAQLTAALQNTASHPLLIAIDQEGGAVSRLKPSRGFRQTPSAAELGRLNDPDSTYRSACVTAETLRAMGINLNFAPVVDLDINPDNPVIGGLGRSFSHDPDTVTVHARQTIRAMEEAGIITALKHFPGHGSSATDTHKDFTDISGSWKKTELTPYANLIDHGYRGMIMTAHVYNSQLDRQYPATLSHSTISGLLRDSLGFGGVVISDDLQMNAVASHYELETAIRLALQAGVDILLFANNSTYDPEIVDKVHTIIRRLIDNGSIPPERIEQSARRIDALMGHNAEHP
ncbi:MAG: beta-N-acetylhexosaminidase [Prosthecochloris sp.]|nr:beta-N-acetylhexosaminidase [Prosthecochloris sp.]